MATPSRSSPVPVSSASIARVEAWTIEHASEALAATHLSSPTPANRTPAVTLDIPLDDTHPPKSTANLPPHARVEPVHTVYRRREPIRRDSLNRREALLKGKEGSRRRQRWENDRLLNNPHAEPPLPSDWQVQPTYPRHNVPYFLAPLWDAQFARATQERCARADAAKAPKSKQDAQVQKVTQELRAKLKKARGAKGLLQDLEQEVRHFVEQWELKEQELVRNGLVDPSDSEDEEIVFVGRNGVTNDDRHRESSEHKLTKDKLIFQSLIDDHGAAFGYVFMILPPFRKSALTFDFPDATLYIPSLSITVFEHGPSPWVTLRGARHMSD